jgi:phosphatidylglycerophosphate synthase
MKAHFMRLADELTLLRLLLVPPLWVLALLDLRVPLGIGLAVAGLTDVLDGPIARRQGAPSRIGSQLDSIADHTLTASALIWLIMFRPEFFREYATVLFAWGGFAIVTLLVGYVRFRRFANVHLWYAKAAGFVGYVFAIWMLLLDGPAAPFFHIVIALAFLATAETLAVFVTRASVDETVGTILRRRRPQR